MLYVVSQEVACQFIRALLKKQVTYIFHRADRGTPRTANRDKSGLDTP